MRVSPIIPSFNAGEISPLLEGRTDFAQLPKGLRVCENFIPLIQGPAARRSGTKFVHEVKDSTSEVRLIPFVFSDEQAFLLEFGDLYIRFYTNRGLLLSGPSPYEIVSPYTEADLDEIRYAQSADVIYLAHPDYPPQKLSRVANTNWTLEDFEFEGGPFALENKKKARIMTADDVTGSITLTASGSGNTPFTADMVGALIKLTRKDNDNVDVWEPGKSWSSTDNARYQENHYEADNSATSGSSPPVHLEGKATDGKGGVNWDFLHAGFGSVQITAYTSSTEVDADVVDRLPGQIAGAGTYRWALGEWSGERGYPRTVTFFQDRLCWGGTRSAPQTVWASRTGDYVNYRSGTVDDAALTFTLNSSDQNEIRWMEGDERGLLIGTAGGEWTMRAGGVNEALTPFNVSVSRSTAYGSSLINPVRAGKAVLFVQVYNRKLREMAYVVDVDGFRAPDMTVRADHVSKGGFVDLAYQSQPWSTLWAPRVDGTLCGFTYDREQEVTAWHRHILGGYSNSGRTAQAIVERVASLPSPTGDADDLWMVVRRYIDGGVKRYVEYLTPIFDHETAQEDAYFVDCGATYDGAAATTISGLDHLEGETVAVLTDGSPHPDCVVTGGEIELDYAASVVQVGLGYVSKMQTERLDAGAADGSAQGKSKRIAEATIRFYRSAGVKFGPDFDNLEELETRSIDDDMDEAVPLFSGDRTVTWPGDWETDGCVAFQVDQPTPCTVLAVVPRMETVSPR